MEIGERRNVCLQLALGKGDWDATRKEDLEGKNLVDPKSGDEKKEEVGSNEERNSEEKGVEDNVRE